MFTFKYSIETILLDLCLERVCRIECGLWFCLCAAPSSPEASELSRDSGTDGTRFRLVCRGGEGDGLLNLDNRSLPARRETADAVFDK